MAMRNETILKRLRQKAVEQQAELQETIDHIAWLEEREGARQNAKAAQSDLPVLELKSSGAEE